MPTPMPSSVALVSARDADPFAQAQMAAAAYLAGMAVGPSRPTATTCARSSSGALTSVSTSSRPSGPTSSCGAPLWRSGAWQLDHRPAAVHHLRLLSLRLHRRPDRLEPSALRPPAEGLSERRPWARPRRARQVPLHIRALRLRPCCSGRLAGSERTAGQRSLCHRPRGSRLRSRPSNFAHHREGKQAGK